jgi:O-antigen ligase
VVVSMLLISLIAFYAVNRMMSRSDYFQERVNDTMEGDTSGRDIYYAFFIDYYLNNTTDEEFLLGMGANATLGIWHNYAHNDWLEIAINQGLFGVFLYLIYWITFLKLCLKKGVEHKIKTALWIVFVIYFLQTFFSMSYSDYTLYSSMVLGYCIACSAENSCKDTNLVTNDKTDLNVL